MDADGNTPDSIQHNDSVQFLGLFTGPQGIGLRRTQSVQFPTWRQAKKTLLEPWSSFGKLVHRRTMVLLSLTLLFSLC